MTKPGQDISNWYSGLDPDTQGDLKDYYTNIEYRHFRDEPVYQTIFAQGSWGKIEDATFETFAEAKTYLSDTIFATEYTTTYEDDEYVPSVDRSIGGKPKYMDVSHMYDTIDKTLPEVYARPGEVTVIEETASPVRVAVADALVVVPNPTGVPIITSGAELYPVPP